MPDGFFETYAAISVCVIMFCTWNKTLNQKTFVHVTAVGFFGIVYIVVPMFNNLIPSFFNSQLYNLLFDLGLVAVVSLLYMCIFYKKLTNRKRDILCLTLLVMAMMPFTLVLILSILFTFIPPE